MELIPIKDPTLLLASSKLELTKIILWNVSFL